MPIPCREIHIRFEEKPAFGVQGVQVWLFDVPGAVLPAPLSNLLSEMETTRAGRFVFERDRRRYTASRVALRLVLGNCLAVAPDRLQFAAAPSGKPYVQWPDTPLRFNLSHSGEKILLAVSGAEIGADIEQVRAGRDTKAVAARYFTPAERRHLETAADSRQAFYILWSAKEAVVKASGTGLFSPFEEIEMTEDARAPLLAFSVSPDYRCSLYPVPAGTPVQFFEVRNLPQFAKNFPP
jgi:4'-phosphopantetheinyl transferase